MGDKYDVVVTITWSMSDLPHFEPQEVEERARDIVNSLLPESRWGEIRGEDIEIEVELV